MAELVRRVRLIFGDGFGGAYLTGSFARNAEDVKWVLRARAPTLAGTSARGFVCQVPGDLRSDTMRPQIENFLEDLLTWTTFDASWSQRNAVEALSRMLYTLEHGDVISKKQALEWAKDVMPDECQGLIREVSEDRLGPWNAPPRPGTVERTLTFVEYAK